MNRQIHSTLRAAITTLLLLPLLLVSPTLRAATTLEFATLHEFAAYANGLEFPEGALVQGADGDFYGTTKNGGDFDNGSVFKMTPAGVVTILHSFSPLPLDGLNKDGIYPEAALVQGADGDFYGTTYQGGIYGYGTVFKITPGGTFSTLHSFGANNTDGLNPFDRLIQGKDGNLYGTTGFGGETGFGTVFKITLKGAVTILHSFADDNQDGTNPNGGLIQGKNGNLYGMTEFGGSEAFGTAFRIATTGGALKILHSFGSSASDGHYPYTSLVQGTDGDFYGTTYEGGSGEYGTVFKMTAGGAVTTIHNFSSVDANGTNNDGAIITAALIQGKDGDFYGTAYDGGTEGIGTVFKITAGGTFTTLHDFGTAAGDGANPYASLVQGTDGELYGVTNYGGGQASGLAFKITTAGKLTLLRNFGFGNTGGADPDGSLLIAQNGDLYGTTLNGGPGGVGTIFKLPPGGAPSVVYNFPAADGHGFNQDGGRLRAGLVQASDGDFYGSAGQGGTHGLGTVFKLSASGTVTVLHEFDGTDGVEPSAVILGRDGALYGTTLGGGQSSLGTVFRLTTGGAFATLHSFAGTNEDDGASPLAGLVQGKGGDFYGTTLEGGSANDGTIFRISSTGDLTILHEFGNSSKDAPVSADGAGPSGGLVQAKDGDFYGTTITGGSAGRGTAFRIGSEGVFKVLHHFGDSASNAAEPEGNLIQGSDGDIYGTSFYGGERENGTVFKLTTGGTFTIVHSFTAFSPTGTNQDGARPTAGLTQAADGTIYGVAEQGGSHGTGTVFALYPISGPPKISSAPTASATVGKAFSYAIKASNHPTSYGATGLPSGLSVNANTGVISGTPASTASGTKTLHLSAMNAAGTGTATLTLTIAK